MLKENNIIKPTFIYPLNKPNSKEEAQHILEQFFLCSGNLRLPIDNQEAKPVSSKSKKGYEIRFVARSLAELELIQESIKILNYNLSKSYLKHNRFIQPLYGKDITLKFKRLKDEKSY